MDAKILKKFSINAACVVGGFAAPFLGLWLRNAWRRKTDDARARIIWASARRRLQKSGLGR